MIKKILFTLCLLCTLFVACAISSSAEENDHMVGLLNAVGIIDGDIQTDGDSVVTRAQFVFYINRAMNINEASTLGMPKFTDVSVGYWAYNDIITAESMGLIHGYDNGKFNPDEPIALREALNIVLRALNYNNIMEYDKISNATVLASELGLLKGINAVWDAPISSDNVCRLLYNAINADMADVTSYSSDGTAVYKKESGKTILSEYHDIYYISGVVQSDEYSALYGGKANAGNILIDEVAYTGTEKQIENLIGFKVKCYYEKNSLSDERNLVYIYKYDNNEANFSFDDVSDFNASEFKVFDSNNKIKEYSIDSKSTILLNKTLVSNINDIKTAISAKAGKVKLIDNNDDDVYEVAIIESYYNMIVQSFDGDAIIIRGTNNEKVNLESYKKYIIRDCMGKSVKYTDIKADMLLSVFEPNDANGTLIIIIGQNVIKDTINSVDSSEKMITGNDEHQYEFSKSAVSDINDIIVGESYDIYLDFNNMVVYVVAKNQQMTLGYLVNAAKKNQVGNELVIKLFNQNGVMSCYDTKSSVYIRLADGTEKQIGGVDLLSCLKNGDDIKRQIIKYYLTEDKKISKIWLLANDKALPFHMLNDDLNKTRSYEYRDLNFGGKYMLTNDTVIYVVPRSSSKKTDDKEFKIGTKAMFKNGSSYTMNKRVVATAVSNEANAFLTDVFIYEIDYDISATISETVLPKFIASYSRAISDDGEDIYRLTVINNDGKEEKFDYYDLDGSGLVDMNGRKVAQGDIIRVSTDERGHLTKQTLDSMYDCKNDISIKYLALTYLRYIPSVRVIPAQVLQKQNGTYIKFVTKSGMTPGDGVDSEEIINIATAQVIIFDKISGKYTRTTYDKVGIGDSFIMTTSLGTSKLIIYYK